ncbi:MAG: thiamine-phosphate kinase [Deltaproteobacteria bacterium]|nr:thiamine-phosphate kinase [Deltaproteobacteria bacterium]
MISAEKIILKKISELLGSVSDQKLIVPNGDDAAVFENHSQRSATVITTDSLVDHVHFDLSYTSWEDLGWKSIAVNLSDVAAMGAKPSWVTISLILPDWVHDENLLSFYQGVRQICERFDVAVVGGDLNRGKELVVSVTALGELNANHVKTRNGAKEGDLICLAGQLGHSALGLRCLQNNPQNQTVFTKAHLRPEPQIKMGQILGSCSGVSALIDVSDGLAKELPLLLEKKNLTALVNWEALPLGDSYFQVCQELQLDPEALAFGGGEDYALLFTLEPSHQETLQSLCSEQGLGFSLIGVLEHEAHKETQGKIVLIKDGEKSLFAKTGFDHFSG